MRTTRPGRPRLPGDWVRITTPSLRPELAHALRAESEHSGVPVVEIVRRAIADYLDHKLAERQPEQ